MGRFEAMRIGILTAGGDAPGMNAMLYNLHLMLKGHELFFFQDSYKGLTKGT